MSTVPALTLPRSAIVRRLAGARRRIAAIAALALLGAVVAALVRGGPA
ncbi:MAG: hypothetical protein JSR54_07545, partial [Proteobacteria bacterium]|nr:hypothetical protein [Pseudomonadota bacterium]